MLIVTSKNGVPIRLTRERWAHITSRHPELDRQRDRVLETIEEPQFVQAGDFGESLAVRRYAKTPLSSKFLVVAYRETEDNDGFVLTAYFTGRPSQRRAIQWKP